MARPRLVVSSGRPLAGPSIGPSVTAPRGPHGFRTFFRPVASLWGRRPPGTLGGGAERGQPMTERGSVTGDVRGLRAGDEAAAQRLWEGYFRRLVGLARARLAG